MINLYYYIKQEINMRICQYKGHRWIVESEISPESGTEYFECKRCGFSHEPIIYY